ncbi:MAG: hypothetical protein AAFU58_04150 [Pseudomonadota bacterium]
MDKTLDKQSRKPAPTASGAVPPGKGDAAKKSPSGPGKNAPSSNGQPRPQAAQTREDKLAEALRANLRRRKQANR